MNKKNDITQFDHCYLESVFGNLSRGKYEIRRPPSILYNCMALVHEDRSAYWCPYNSVLSTRWITQKISRWPSGIARNWKPETIIELFVQQGYRRLPINDDIKIEGYQRVALYLKFDESKKEKFEHMISHVCKEEMESGMWLSKLGADHEIAHENLAMLTGWPDGFGRVHCIMARPYPILDEA